MRLIDADRAMEIVRDLGIAHPNAYHLTNYAMLILREAPTVDAVPAANVAPVRHGRWVDKGEYAVCTECGGRSGTQYDGVEPIPLMTQFCPNCGCRFQIRRKENDYETD